MHLSYNVERLSKKLLMKFVARMSGVRITGAPLTKFHLYEYGGGATSYDIWT